MRAHTLRDQVHVLSTASRSSPEFSIQNSFRTSLHVELTIRALSASAEANVAQARIESLWRQPLSAAKICGPRATRPATTAQPIRCFFSRDEPTNLREATTSVGHLVICGSAK